jgi:hypothetical protein
MSLRWMLLSNLGYSVKNNKSLFNKIINLKKEPIEKLEKNNQKECNSISLNVKYKFY